MTINASRRLYAPAARQGDLHRTEDHWPRTGPARHAGISRLPLLLLLVVIALLIAVAIPIWQDRTIRGRVIDVLGAAAKAPEGLSAYVATQGELPMPADPTLDGLLEAATAPDRVAEATWASDGGGVGATGVLTLTLAEAKELGTMSGAAILVTATVIGGRQVTWACAPADPELSRFLPAACGDLFE